MFDWYRGMNRDGRRTFWACFSGYALDAMDVQIYSFVVPVLIGLWGMTLGEAGMLGIEAVTGAAPEKSCAASSRGDSPCARSTPAE